MRAPAAAEQAESPQPEGQPPRPRRRRTGTTTRSKMRRGYQDKMLRPAAYADKSQGWDLYGGAPA